MAEQLPNPSEDLANFSRRDLLGNAVAIGAASIVPSAAPSQPALIDPANILSKTSAPVLKFCAATTRRLLEIESRNELRREVKLPLLSVAKELRRIKQAEDEEKFSRFATRHRVAVWNQVLKSRREKGANWKPSWMEGIGYQSEVYRLLRQQFRVERRLAAAYSRDS